VDGGMIVQDFLKLTLTDGTPLWVVIVRDIVIPVITIGGGVFAFFAWNRRKKKEHKLMHQTKAYAILLDREMDCYSEILDTLRQADKQICETVFEMPAHDLPIQKPVELKTFSNYKKIDNRIQELYKTTNIYIAPKIAEKIKNLSHKISMAYIRMIIISKAKGSSDKEKIRTKIDEAVELLVYISEDLIGEIEADIKAHLESISRIK